MVHHGYMTSVAPTAPHRSGSGDAPARERVVLCAPDGTAVGTADKVDVHGLDTPLHLAFSCYVFDDEGRVLVTRRAHDKRTFPGVRTNSCCGHPAPGEPIESAVHRRVLGELGLHLRELTLILPRFRYRAVAADGVVENELCPVFRAVADGADLRPDPVEVDAAWWAPWPQFGADDAEDPLSAWGCEQLAELDDLGADPMAWPAADPGLLPAAASVDGHPSSAAGAGRAG
jgi:isopentenyl-diphosphate delta-isomerase